MNYLILTPDGVGSTILQRLITMAFYLETVPVINTHELTNGLILKNGVVNKNFELGYTQKLEQIIDILNSSSKKIKVVSRVAKYHLDYRKDTPKEQKHFFTFLNKFYQKKIMCVRENIFEYAMSWSIREKSGVFNVYNRDNREKVSQVSEIDENFFIEKCQDYVDYQKWIKKNFTNVQLISYEDMVINSDSVIENLIGYKDTFKNNFDVPLSVILKKEYEFFKSITSRNNIQTLTKKEQKSLIEYKKINETLIKKGIVFGSPIKNTTLVDKKRQIKNFNQCLDKFYSFAKNYNWIDQSKATYDFWNKKHIC